MPACALACDSASKTKAQLRVWSWALALPQPLFSRQVRSPFQTGRPRRFRPNPHLPAARTADASPEESPQAHGMSLRKEPGVGDYRAILHRFPRSARAWPAIPSRTAGREVGLSGMEVGKL